MSRPSKPMAKNSNSKFTTRNNRQEIFSRIAKITKTKVEENNKTDNDDSIKEDEVKK